MENCNGKLYRIKKSGEITWHCESCGLEAFPERASETTCDRSFDADEAPEPFEPTGDYFAL